MVRSIYGLVCALASIALGCSGAEGGEESGVVLQPSICGDPDFQDVERYTPAEGISASFVLDHDNPVGYWGCSGTLIGDGLFITAAHCIEDAALGERVTFNYQVDSAGNARETESFRIAQILEDGPVDHGLLRLFHNPETRWGSTAIHSADPSEGDVLTIIGHPDLDGATDYKKVEVGTAAQVSDSDIRYRNLDTEGGNSGSGILGTNGKLVGVHRGSTGCTEDEVANRGNPITRIFGVSEFVHGARGSGRHYSFSDSGARTLEWNRPNWRSTYRHVVAGRFTSAFTDQLFFYDSEAGEGQFETVTNTVMTELGPEHTGLRKTWTLIVPVQIDSTPQLELLFYDGLDGYGRFYRTDGAGSLTTVSNHPGWGRRWRQIVAGDFTSRSGDELVFYNSELGEIHVYGTNSNGTITLLKKNTGFSGDVSIIVAGEFHSSGPRREVMLYNPRADFVTFLRFADDGTTTEFGRRDPFGTHYTQIVSGSFPNGAQLAFYQPSAFDIYPDLLDVSIFGVGTIAYYKVTNGTLEQTRIDAGERRSYAKMVSGKFTIGAVGQVVLPKTSLILYDRFKQ